MKKNLEIGIPLMYCLGIGISVVSAFGAALGLSLGLLFSWLTPYGGVNVWAVIWKCFCWGVSIGTGVGLGAWILWIVWLIYSLMILKSTRNG